MTYQLDFLRAARVRIAPPLKFNERSGPELLVETVSGTAIPASTVFRKKWLEMNLQFFTIFNSVNGVHNVNLTF